MSRALRFVVAFLLWAVVGHAVLSVPWVERTLVGAWVHANIAIATTLVGATAGDRLIEGEGVSLSVGKGCDGMGALLVVSAAMLAAPARRRTRLLGIVVASGVVFTVNATRLATLYLVARHWPERLELFHVDIWQPLMMLVALGTFILWGRVGVERAGAKSAAA